MGRFFTKTIATAVAVLIVAYLLKGVTVDNSITALLVALVLGLLNNFIKPVLILLTIPFTVFTLGLFLIVTAATQDCFHKTWFSKVLSLCSL